MPLNQPAYQLILARVFAIYFSDFPVFVDYIRQNIKTVPMAQRSRLMCLSWLHICRKAPFHATCIDPHGPGCWFAVVVSVSKINLAMP